MMKQVAVQSLVKEAVDYAITHGIGLVDAQESNKFTHLPITLFPTPFSKEAFDAVIDLAPTYNLLVDNIARNEEWLFKTLQCVVEADDFTKELVSICKQVKAKGCSQMWYLGINRSDYMLKSLGNGQFEPVQVELNTIAAGLGCLSSRLVPLHKYLLTRMFELCQSDILKDLKIKDKETTLETLFAALPSNNSEATQAAALAEAMKCFNEETGASSKTILFVVQEGERNVFDQRCLEYALFENHQVIVIRKTLNQIGSQAEENEAPFLKIDDRIISVVYFRAGYTPKDYPTAVEWIGRRRIEFSNAIKCPCISYHLAGTKKVQQRLAVKGELELFLSDEDAKRVRKTFTGLWSLDSTNQTNEDKNMLEAAKSDYKNFVMKPQREGGGNNLYGEDIKVALETLTTKELSAYILMQRIFPYECETILIRDSQFKSANSVSELGIFGVFLGNGRLVKLNSPAGHLVRTKPHGLDEGGIASGYSHLDSSILIL